MSIFQDNNDPEKAGRIQSLEQQNGDGFATFMNDV